MFGGENRVNRFLFRGGGENNEVDEKTQPGKNNVFFLQQKERKRERARADQAPVRRSRSNTKDLVLPVPFPQEPGS